MHTIEIRIKAFEGFREVAGKLVCRLTVDATREVAEDVAMRLSRESMDPSEQPWVATVTEAST